MCSVWTKEKSKRKKEWREKNQQHKNQAKEKVKMDFQINV